jgi:hypoxanthine phosphoribosyltransferase
VRRRKASQCLAEPVGELAQAEKAASDSSNGEVIVSGQQRLPLPWHLVRPFGESSFAHPAELDLARILTFYGIRWVYEPTTFHLALGEDGRPVEQVTPDFYLPDHRVYIELTTMRQRLVTKKNRKIRRLKENFPTVNIKLLYRKDYHRLIESYPFPIRQSAVAKVGRVLFTEEQIATRIRELAEQIACVHCDHQRLRPVTHRISTFCASLLEDTPAAEPIEGSLHLEQHATAPPEPLQLLAFGSGSRTFLTQLERELMELGECPISDQISLSRYRARDGGRRVRVGRTPHFPIEGREIILVTDVVSTGLSLSYLTNWLGRHGARRVRICALLDRREARLIDVPLDFVGFEAPNELLVGFGLAMRRQFRDLPYIAAMAFEQP